MLMKIKKILNIKEALFYINYKLEYSHTKLQKIPFQNILYFLLDSDLNLILIDILFFINF